MPVEIEIADNSYLVEADSLTTSLRAGIAGPQLDFRLIPGQGFPPMQKPVSISLGGLSFEGILNDDNRDSANTHIAPRTYSAVGKHVFLNRDVDVSYRGLTSVADLADDLVFPTGMAFSVVGDTRNIQSFAFKGNLTQALQYLAVKGKYLLHFGLAGIELVDKLNPPAAPFNWIYQSTSGWKKIPKRFSSEIPYNKIFVEGGVPKLLPEDPDEEEIEVAYVGNGIQARFKYPRKTDEVFDVTLDGESLTICQEGDPLQASFDCFNDRGETEVVFNTPPGEGIEIILFCRIQRALGMWENTALQSEFAAAFGGDGKLIYRDQRPEIRTQAEADEYAESLGLLFGQVRKEYSAEVWGSGIFYPGRAVLVNDSRDGVNDTLLVQQVQLTYKSHLGRWTQQVTVGNGSDGDVSGSATAYVQAVGGGGIGNQITTKQPPTETSQANTQDFTLALTPGTQNVTDGESGPATFTAEISPINGFDRAVTLSKTGLAGTTATWIPDNVITGGSGTRTLELTPTDGTWTDAQADEEGTFTVTGVSGPKSHTADGEVVIDEAGGGENCCDSLTVEVDAPDPLPNCYQEFPSSLNFTIQFVSENSPCSVQWKIRRGGSGGPIVDEGSGSLPLINFTATIEDGEVWDSGNVDISDNYRLLYWCGSDAPEDPESWYGLDILSFACA